MGGRRRLTTAVYASVALTLAAVTGSAAGAGAQEPERPNVLVIVTDDQRARGTLKVMPSLTGHFGDTGVDFANGFATTPTCCPSRASIFTGRYAHNHEVKDNTGRRLHLLDHTTTMQRYLSEAGYRTALYGKYLNGWDIEQPPPYFDDWVHLPYGYYDTTVNDNGTIRVVNRYSTIFLANQARRFIEENEADDERPWFVYLSFWAPHEDAMPRYRYRDADVPRLRYDPAKREEDRSDKPPYVRRSTFDRDKVERFHKDQLRTLISVDEEIAALFSELAALGEDTNTLAFYLSDNGMQLGDHGLVGKGTPYDPATRVPMFMRWPARVPGGVIDRRLVANIDIAPTVFDAAGITPEHEVDGRSLLQSWDRPRLLFEIWGTLDNPDLRWASIRSKTEQYVEYYERDMSTVTYREYYDLESDPWQLLNLLGDGDLLNDPPDWPELRMQLMSDRRCSGSDCP